MPISSSAISPPLDLNIDNPESHGGEVPHGHSLMGGQYVGVRLIRLQHQPHSLDIFFGVSPITLSIEIAEFHHIELAELDPGDRIGDLAGDEFFSPQWRFVIEQNAAAAEDTKRFTVVHRSPMGVQFGHSVGSLG